MDRRSFYLLLGALASSAMASCQDEECDHQVEIEGPGFTLSANAACQEISAAAWPEQWLDARGYGIAPDRCTKLCGSSSFDICHLPTDYVDAIVEKNGPFIFSYGDAGPPKQLACPTWTADVSVQCVRYEQRGKWHDGCPINGRRPSGLVASQRSRRDDVASYLARSAHLEAASVHAFERIAAELMALGAPAVLMTECLQAAREETEHARRVGALSRARGAEPEPVDVAAARAPCAFALALENAAEGVVREAYGALQALVSSRRAQAADVRATMAAITRDEASHAELSLRIGAWLDTQLSEEQRARVACERRAAIAQLRSELADEPSQRMQRELGLPSRALALKLVDRLETAVWMA